MSEDWDEEDDAIQTGKWSLGDNNVKSFAPSTGWGKPAINGNTGFGSGSNNQPSSADDDGWEESTSSTIDQKAGFCSGSRGFGSSGGFGGTSGGHGRGRGTRNGSGGGFGDDGGGGRFGSSSGGGGGFGSSGGGRGFGTGVGGRGGFGSSSVGRGGGGFGTENGDAGSDDGWNEGGSNSGFGGGFGRGGGVLGGRDADDAGGRGGGFGGGIRGRGGGSGCRKCGEEGHFARDCPSGGSASGGSGACRICNEEGHFARECPNKGSSGRSNACRICNEEGHFARECPNKGSGGFGSTDGGGFGSRGDFSGGNNSGGFGGGGGSSGGCRICGEEGHFAKECPNKGQETCRKCGNEGHFARDCPDADGEERPARVSYVPPDPSQEEEVVFRTIAQGINFDKYDEIPCEVTGHGNIPKAVRSFKEANLYDSFLTNVEKAKYRKPTPVQKYAIPILLSGRDLMACAQTGSGKTAAFLLPVLTSMMNEGLTGSSLSGVQSPAGLVISPTRELTSQIYMEARKFSHDTMLRPVVCYGGVSVNHQLKQINNGCHLLVATPGRLKDFLSKGKLSLANLKYLILDEADRMLDMGFMPDVRTIVEDYGMPRKEERQTAMFSATFPEEIQKLAAEFLNDYVFLTIGRVGGTSSDIEQIILDVPESGKREKLVEILGEQGLNRNLVFVQTKRSADFLASFLSQSGFPTTSIHGDRLQQQREEALRDFRAGRCPVLIATAVAARGLDIEDVKQVINYDLPDEIDEYVHRIGRTGRIGNKGKAISFFSAGKDDGLARALVKILSDSEQVVPSWLEDAAETALGTGYGPKGGKYGAKDTRKFNAGGGDFKVGVFNAGGDNDDWGDSGSSSGFGGSSGTSGGFKGASGGGFGNSKVSTGFGSRSGGGKDEEEDWG